MIVIALLTLQPPLGLVHHAKYTSAGKRTLWGMLHLWLGRVLMLLGAINGGLGLMLAKNSTKGKIAWGVIAGVVGLAYVAIVAVTARKGANSEEREKVVEGNGERE